MPDPLENPFSVTVTPSISAARVAPFGNVSVVIIAVAAAFHDFGESFSFSRGNAFVSRSTGKGSPITPVEDTNIWFF